MRETEGQETFKVFEKEVKEKTGQTMFARVNRSRTAHIIRRDGLEGLEAIAFYLHECNLRLNADSSSPWAKDWIESGLSLAWSVLLAKIALANSINKTPQLFAGLEAWIQWAREHALQPLTGEED